MVARTGRSVKREVRIPFDLAEAIDVDTEERRQSFSDWIRAAAVVRLDGKYEPPAPPERQLSPSEAIKEAERARARAIIDQPTVGEVHAGIAVKGSSCPHPRSKLQKLAYGTVCTACGVMVR